VAAEKSMVRFSKFFGWSKSVDNQGTHPEAGAGSNGIIASSLDYVPVDTAEVDFDTRIALITDPKGPGADRFRRLRMNLREFKTLGSLSSLAITSALPGDGKSTVVLNLATALAEGGKRTVLVIDGDMHKSSLASTLKLPPHPGLAECLEAGLDPLSAIRRIEPVKWYLLQVGQPIANPSELVQSPAFPKLMEKLSPYFEWIVIDTPPLAALNDAVSISRVVDGCLLVVRADSTPRHAVDEAVSSLGTKRIAGIVVNAAEGLNELYSKYSQYYGKQ
jgi:succinoglycan biosynthesis transport protein ExoP